ncbi:MAG: tetratricopeptide repeat protein [Candidatus Omnitrophota bacterium]
MVCRAWGWPSVFSVILFLLLVPADFSYAGAPQAIAHYIMGVSFELQDKTQSAFQEYQKSAQADPASFAANMRLGIAASDIGEHRRAVQSFAAASRLKPDDLQARYLLALSYAALRDYGHAAEQFEIILKAASSIDPGNADIRMFLARLYYAQGKPKSALGQFETLLSIDPTSTMALLQVGSYYLDHGRRDEGKALLKRCLEFDPRAADCLNALGYSYAEDGVLLQEARDLVRRALEIEPDNAAYLDSLGWVFFKQGESARAIALLRRALHIEKDPAIFDHLGDVYQKLGRIDMALESWRQALALDRTMPGLSLKIQQAQKALKKQ